jgi:hypothetical protein
MNDEPTVEVGGPIDASRAHLCLYGDDLIPDEVSSVLGLQPTEAHRKGDPSRTPGHGYGIGSWVLTCAVEKPDEPENALTSLLNSLPADPELWRELKNRYVIRITLGLTLLSWNRGFTLPAPLLRRIADLGIEIGFDIYYIGDN